MKLCAISSTKATRGNSLVLAEWSLRRGAEWSRWGRVLWRAGLSCRPAISAAPPCNQLSAVQPATSGSARGLPPPPPGLLGVCRLYTLQSHTLYV